MGGQSNPQRLDHVHPIRVQAPAMQDDDATADWRHLAFGKDGEKTLAVLGL